MAEELLAEEAAEDSADAASRTPHRRRATWWSSTSSAPAKIKRNHRPRDNRISRRVIRYADEKGGAPLPFFCQTDGAACLS